MDKRIAKNIYAVKGLGALLIVIYHYSVWYNNYIHEISLTYFNFAYLTFAVPLFFVFSAFFLYKKAVQLKHPVKLVLHRMTRLYPMYWIAVLFSAVVILLNQEELGVKQILLNLTMVEKVFGVEHIDGAYWTMFYELMLLLIFAIASILTVKKERLICRTFEFCVGWLLIGALSAFFMKIAGISSSTVAVILFACRYTPVFVFGIILSNRYLLEETTLTNRQFVGVGIACIVYELLLAVDVYQSLYGIAAIVVAYLVVSGAFISSRVLSNSILIFLGKISYNTYLIHNQFGRVIISRCGGQPIVCVLLMILTALAAILIAYVFSKLEIKIVKWIDKAVLRR